MRAEDPWIFVSERAPSAV